ncbi:MAG: HYR domain-containing protein, partial [Gammaproteobacteria bacterium]|nr:HYR domain-containing protein [Gammaproteobacteria bacterium]
VENDASACGADVTYSVTSSDNCSGESIAQTAGQASGTTFGIGITTNSFTVTDASGNTSSCSFTVTVADTEDPVATCPANISVENDASACGADVTYSVTSSDNCSGESIAQTAGQASGTTFGIGITTNSFTVTDASGNTSSCSFTVTVADTEDPVATCPANISVSTDEAECEAMVNYNVNFNDNCSGATLSQTTGQASASFFPVGTTMNSFTVTDASGNTASCSFTVTVADTEAPFAVCQDITIDLDVASSASITAGDVDGGSVDGCGIASLSIDVSTFGCPERGSNTVTLTVTDIYGNNGACAADVFVDDPLMSCCVIQDVVINQGWNMISSFVQPDDPDMMAVIQSIASEVVIVKDGDGNVVLPSITLNQIGNWDVSKGYKLKSESNTVLHVQCEPVLPELTPIGLPVGWSLISYLRNSAMDASAAFAAIAGDVIIVKNGDGDIYLPAFALNTIGDMLPGQGYHVKMQLPGVLMYPANTARVAAGNIPYTPLSAPQRLQYEGNTGNNASIIIPEGSIPQLDAGDEIGVYNQRGDLVGSAAYREGHMAITVWGNDVSTGDESHMTTGEPYVLRVWKSDMNEAFDLEVEFRSTENTYEVNGISILEQGKMDLPASVLEISSIHVYPNPVQTALTMEIVLENASDVVLSVYDISGALVLTQEHARLQTGHTFLDVDVSALSSGEYFFSVQTNEKLFNGEFVRLR